MLLGAKYSQRGKPSGKAARTQFDQAHLLAVPPLMPAILFTSNVLYSADNHHEGVQGLRTISPPP